MRGGGGRLGMDGPVSLRKKLFNEINSIAYLRTVCLPYNITIIQTLVQGGYTILYYIIFCYVYKPVKVA